MSERLACIVVKPRFVIYTEQDIEASERLERVHKGFCLVLSRLPLFVCQYHHFNLVQRSMLRRLALHTGPYRRSGRIQAAASRSLFSLRSSPQKTAGISESAGLISVPNTRELGLVRRKASSKRHLATEVGTAATMKMSESADPWAATYSISPLYNHLNPDVLPDGYEQTRDSHGREYAVLQKPIVKSQSDDREYRYV